MVAAEMRSLRCAPPQTARHSKTHAADRTISYPERRQLLQPGSSPGLYVEVFPKYGNSSVPAVLPIPTSVQPARVTTAANLSYPESSSSDLFQLAGVSTYFGLRFSGIKQRHSERTYAPILRRPRHLRAPRHLDIRPKSKVQGTHDIGAHL